MLHFLYRSQAEKKLTPHNKKGLSPSDKTYKVTDIKT